MTQNKLFIIEKLVFLAVLVVALIGFWYFEESLILKIVALILTFFGLIVAVVKGKKADKNALNSRFELLSLLIIYLGVYALYNLIYSISLPIYIVMTVILVLVSSVTFSILNIDHIDEQLNKNLFYSFAVLMGLIVVEVFLGLYFWPINIEIKSLVLVIVFYQIMSVIYLYVRSMLRLNKIIGFLIVNLLILAIVFWELWSKLPK